MRKFLFYKAFNTVTGKSYVGYTSKNTVNERWDEHIRDALVEQSKSHLHRSIRKYGTGVWNITQIEQGYFDGFISAGKRESELIAEHRTFDYGYNMTCGGEGGFTISKHSPERKREIYLKGVETRIRNGNLQWTPSRRSAYNNRDRELYNSINRKRSALYKSRAREIGDRVRLAAQKRSPEKKKQISEAISEKVKTSFRERKEDVERWERYCLEISKRVKKVVNTPIGVFDSLQEASAKTGIANTTLRRKIKNENEPEYYYIQ